jgi:CheY-like chemotaxis protein
MPEENSATSRRWTAGALRAARAAAFLTLATGINGTLAAYLPRYEPFYVYLISVVVVAWLSSMLLGITTAIAAVICYDWYFSPLTTAPSASTVVPLTIAVAAAIVTQLAKRPVMRINLAEPASQRPLLTGDVSYATVDVTDSRIADLEERLATARSVGDGEARLRAEAAQQARAREAALERELDTMRVAAADQSSRVASLRRDVEAAKQRNLDLDGKVAALQQELEVAYRKTDEERGRAEQRAALNAEFDAARQAVLDERARADREAHLRAQLEQAARQTLQRTADVAASHQRGEQEAQAALKVAEERLIALDADRDAAATRADLLQQELERVRVILDDETARADREAELREQLETASEEKLHRVANELSARHEGVLAGLNEQLAVERAKWDADRDAARVEARTLEDRLAELPEIVRERDELRLALAQTAEQYENAGREARTLRHSLTELEGALAELAARYEAAAMEARDRQAIDGERKDLQRSNERLVREIEALRQELDGLRSELGEQRAANDRLRAEHDAQLESIVTGLTNDYESAIGDAIVERETARAEARELTARVTALDETARELKDRLQAASAELQTARHVEQQQAAASESMRETAQAVVRELTGRVAMLDRTVQELTDRLQVVTGNLATARAAEQQQIVAAQSLRAEYDMRLESARADTQSLGSRVAELEESLRAAQSAEQEARAATEALRSEYDAKLESVVDRLTADYERSVTQAVLERETLRSELQAMTASLTEQTGTADRLREATAAMAQRLADQTATSQRLEEAEASMEARLAEEATRRAAVEAERDDVRDQLAELRRELASAVDTASGFDAKLQNIVNGLTSDYEQAIGEATVEKETARAELRSVTAKLQDAQRKLASSAEAEKAAREKVDAEWSEKLQKIVSNLASDHEADLGDAMVAKEAAKAEARSLSQKLASLQQRLAEEREQFRRLTERWQSERAELLQAGSAAVAPPAAANSIPVVLVVHSDAGVRAMARHALEQSGYAVLTASDGLEGLRVAGAQKPDVVLAEAVMPKMNGRELVQLLKSRSETAGMKIVLMSGANVGPFENASDFHADDFLQNPNDFAVMRATLASVLARPR